MDLSRAFRDDSLIVRGYRVGFGMLVAAAVIYQLTESTNIANFFSFFTIQSNIIGGVVLLIGGLVVPAESMRWDLIRGGATIYLMLTGVIYNTLLVGLEEDLQLVEPWVNVVLHTAIPIVMVLDFLLVPLAHRLRWRDAVVWTIYPLLYLVYSLVRGAVVDWYPYPFLDPRREGGYPRVFLFGLLVLVVFQGTIWLMTKVNDARLRGQVSPVAAG